MNYWEQFLAWIAATAPKLLGAALILIVGWQLSNAVAKIMAKAMERSKADYGFVSFFVSLIKTLMKIIVCITAVGQFMDVTSIIAAVGAAGVTAGLALKDNLSNIASGAQIIFTKPFRAGDYLSVDNVEGTVERIEIMFTTLRTFDNKEIVIPNSTVTVSTITNYTAMENRRLDLTYSVSYSADLTAVKSLLSGIVGQHSLVLQDPAPLVAVGEHKDSSISIVVKVWCKSENYWTLYYDMQERVKKEFDAAGVSIPFPQLDVHMKSGS